MLRVEGAINIEHAKKLTTPTFRSNHAHFCIPEAIGQAGKDFLVVYKSSKSTRAYYVV